MSTSYKNNSIATTMKKSMRVPGFRPGWLRPLPAVLAGTLTCCRAQSQAGVYDFGLARAGERRGSWTPGEWLAATLLLMTIALGLAVSLGLCYYVRKGRTRTSFGVAPAGPAHLAAYNNNNNNNNNLLVARI